MTNIMLYNSKNVVDEIYREMVGPVITNITRSTKEKESVLVNLGLSNILSWLGSFSISLGKANQSDSTSTISTSPSERAAVIVGVLRHQNLKDISEITQSTQDNVYKFSLPLKVSRIRKSKLIEIKHESEKIDIIARSSPDNWLADSVLNTILFDSGNDMKLQASGVLVPFSVSNKTGKLIVSVQFVVLYQGNIWEK